MLSNISELGPGFEYFLNTHCQDWDAIQYYEAWKDSNLGLDKVVVTRSFCKQIQKIKKNGTEEKKKNAIHLENQFK
ncbi:18300_t:CDS:1, partial [Gigaspora margarita]